MCERVKERKSESLIPYPFSTAGSVHRALRWLVLILLTTLPFLLQNCAQVAQPPGGKKDSLAPKVVATVPTMRQLNYEGKTVELYFDEYVKTENIQQKITVTPQDSNTYIVKSLPEGVRLTFARPFQPNTTYTIDFSDGIKDISEGNIAKDAKIVFSTGPTIDSLYLSGTVIDDETRQPILGFVVGLFAPTDTLPINRKRPQYFDRTDSSGNFRIENVRAGRYKVYGFDDKDLNLVNNTPGERVAFRDSVLNLTRDYTGIDLVAFRGYGKPRVSRRERTDETLGLELSSGIASYTLRVTKPASTTASDSLISFLESPKLIRIYRPANRAAGDTINVGIMAVDSVGNTTDLKERVYFSPLKTRARDRKPLAVQITPTSGDPIDNDLDFTLTFNKPILRYALPSIIIGPDTTKPIKLDTSMLRWSNSYSRLNIKQKTNLRDSLVVLLEKGSFISVQGDTLPRFFSKYRLADDESFGLIAGRVNRPDDKFIVELLDDKYTVIRTAYGTKSYSFARLKPGRYRVRLVIDANGNRRRDIGNVQKGIQPETIIYHPGAEEGGLIPLKQNFELTDIDFL